MHVAKPPGSEAAAPVPADPDLPVPADAQAPAGGPVAARGGAQPSDPGGQIDPDLFDAPTDPRLPIVPEPTAHTATRRFGPPAGAHRSPGPAGRAARAKGGEPSTRRRRRVAGAACLVVVVLLGGAAVAWALAGRGGGAHPGANDRAAALGSDGLPAAAHRTAQAATSPAGLGVAAPPEAGPGPAVPANSEAVVGDGTGPAADPSGLPPNTTRAGATAPAAPATSAPRATTAPAKATASPRPATPKPTASAKKNPYTSSQVCGSGYSKIDTHVLTNGSTTATIVLMYNGSTNCVAVMKSGAGVGVAQSMSAWVQAQNGKARVTDSGSFLYYAGPARVSAKAICVKWGGSIGSVSWGSAWSHCG